MGRSDNDNSDHSGYDSSARSSDSEREVVVRSKKSSSKTKRKKVEVIPLEYPESWAKVQQLRTDLSSSKTAKNNAKLPWAAMLPSLRKHAEEIGFSLDELNILWNIVSNPSIRSFFQPERHALILLLIPTSSIPGSFVEKICLWAVQAANSGPETARKVKMSTITQVLKYIYGLVEYSLIEGDCFNKPFVYNMLFSLNGQRDLVEWLFLILSKVSTKEVVQRFHIQITSKLWKLPNTASQKKAIVNVLKLFKVLRPDYFPENVFAIHVNSRGSRPKLRDDFRELLITAKRRMLALTGRSDAENFDLTDPSQIFHNSFFPETCPSFSNHTWKDIDSSSCPKNSIIIWALLKPSRLGIFKTNGELLELLQSWLEINFRHKFTSYKAAQSHRYEFLLDRCIEISEIIGSGFEVLDEWLPEFMSMWDMVIWRKKILKLFSYLNVFEFSEFYGQVLRKLEVDFLLSPLVESSEVWQALEHLLIRWIKLAHACRSRLSGANVGDQGNDESVLTSIINLYDFMFALSTKYIALNLYVGVSEPLIVQMIDTFAKLSELFIQTGIPFKPIVPEALFFSVILTDTTDAFDTFLNYLRISDKSDGFPFRNEVDEKSMEKIKGNMNYFFCSRTNFCLSDLFAKELDLLDGRQKSIFEKNLQMWRVELSKVLKMFLCEGRRGEIEYDLAKMEKIAPNLYWYVSNVQNENTSDSSNGANAVGDASVFNPKFSSTPMPPKQKKK